MLHIEEFSAVRLHAENVVYNCVLSDDGPMNLETCSRYGVVILFVGFTLS
jgi:hypothetical protein